MPQSHSIKGALWANSRSLLLFPKSINQALLERVQALYPDESPEWQQECARQFRIRDHAEARRIWAESRRQWYEAKRMEQRPEEEEDFWEGQEHIFEQIKWP